MFATVFSGRMLAVLPLGPDPVCSRFCLFFFLFRFPFRLKRSRKRRVSCVCVFCGYFMRAIRFYAHVHNVPHRCPHLTVVASLFHGETEAAASAALGSIGHQLSCNRAASNWTELGGRGGYAIMPCPNVGVVYAFVCICLYVSLTLSLSLYIYHIIRNSISLSLYDVNSEWWLHPNCRGRIAAAPTVLSLMHARFWSALAAVRSRFWLAVLVSVLYLLCVCWTRIKHPVHRAEHW